MASACHSQSVYQILLELHKEFAPYEQMYRQNAPIKGKYLYLSCTSIKSNEVKNIKAPCSRS